MTPTNAKEPPMSIEEACTWLADIPRQHNLMIPERDAIRMILAERSANLAIIAELVRVERLRQKLAGVALESPLREDYRNSQPLAWRAAFAVVDAKEKV